MEYVKISVYRNSKRINEYFYKGKDQVKALEKCRKDYPDFNDCILIAENYYKGENKNV